MKAVTTSRILTTSIAALVLSTYAPPSATAITVVSGGTTVDFNTGLVGPTATDWTTINAGAIGSDVTWNTIADVDAGVQALTQALMGDTLLTSPTNPPSSNTSGRYNTTLQLLQTKPTGTAEAGVLLLARLNNGTGGLISSLKVAYDYGYTFILAEQVLGHRVYFSLTGLANSWTPVPGLSGVSVTTNGLNATISTTGWAAGANAYLLFMDDNNSGGSDDTLTIDNINFLPTISTRNLTWNLAHTVGGAPNGVWDTSANNYWLNSGTPTAYQAFDSVNFSQNGTASINVPADITPSSTTVSAASGTYTIGGLGKIGGTLTKTNLGTLSLTSANNFTSVTISGGGTVITADAAALGAGSVDIGVGGATLQTVADLTLAGALSGTGALTKTGAGSLRLLNANPITGGITVNAGTLEVVGSLSSLGGSVTIGPAGALSGKGDVGGATTMQAGATLRPGSLGTGTLTLASNVTFNGAATIDYNTGSKVVTFGTVTTNGPGSIVVNVSGQTVQGNTYTVLDYDFSLFGTGAAAFALGSLPNRVIATLADDPVDTAIELTITGVDFPVWTGALNSVWTTGAQGGAENWVLNSNNGTKTTFIATDSPMFDDLAGNTTVNINGADVFPTVANFNNIAKDYTLGGTHGIAGTGGIVKTGAGKLTITNTNKFTGAVAINGGTVSVDTLTDSGVNGPLGGGNTISFDGGTLEYTGAGGSTNRNLSFIGNGTLTTASQVSLSGVLSGAGNFIKDGAGTVFITGTAGAATTTVTTGTLDIGNGGTTGTITGTINNNSIVVFNRSDAFQIGAALGGSGTYSKIGTNTLTIGGATASTNTGPITVTAGSLIAGKTAGTNAIGPGGLVLESGTSFIYAGNNTSNQIADTASITINNASFGDPNATPVNPGATDTVTNVTLNGGFFHSGRNFTLSPYTITGLLKVTAGIALAQRGGSITAEAIEITGGSLNMDGGSTTTDQKSRITVGAGGLTISNAAVNFNAGPSAFTAADSEGSILTLNGDVIADGTVNFNQGNTTTLVTQIELNGGNRTFNVIGGTTTIGSAATAATPVSIVNGGITKSGAGTLSVFGDQAYAGPTMVNGGTFVSHGNLSASAVTADAGGNFQVLGTVATVAANNGGILSGTGTATTVTVGTGGVISPGVNGTGNLTIGSLSLGAVPGDTSSLNVGIGASPMVIQITNPGGFTAIGGPATVTVNIAGAAPVGQYTLVDYEGAIGGTGFAAFVKGTLPNRVEGNLVNDVVNSRIILDVTSIDRPRWTGAASSAWTTAIIAPPKNWVLISNGTTTDFQNGDVALFDDNATNTTVNISGADVIPTVAEFDNSIKDYTLNGTSGIGGAATLIKAGTGTLTINTTNSFTGAVNLNGGTVIVPILSDSSVPGPLGAGLGIAFDGGTLDYTGVFVGATNNRAITVGTGGGTFKTVSDITLSGGISGVGTFTKAGLGTVILSGTQGGFNGGLTIKEGAVRYATDSIGGTSQTVTLDGGTMENNDTATVAFANAAAVLRTLSVTSNGGGVGVLNAAAILEFARPDGIVGAGALRKFGPGRMRVSANNSTYSGEWAVEAGTLEVTSAAPSGLGSGKVTVQTGGTLVFQGDVAGTMPNDILLNGGTISTRSGNQAIFGGNIEIAGDSFASMRSNTTPANEESFTFGGIVSGTGTLTITGASDGINATQERLSLTNAGNTFSGTYRVTSEQLLSDLPALATGNTLGTATIELNSTAAGRLVAGLLIWDDGVGPDGTVVLGNNVTIPNTSIGGQINVNNQNGVTVGNTIQFGNLTIGTNLLATTGGNQYKVEFAGTTTLTGSPTLITDTAPLVLSGAISGSANITKDGTNTLSVNGVNTFTGIVDVRAGTFEVNGSTVAGTDVIVSADTLAGTLAGTGTIGGNVSVTGALGAIDAGRANLNFGKLTIGGNMTLASDAEFIAELSRGAGPTPVAGVEYDQVAVTGDVTLGNAALTLSQLSSMVQGDIFFIILNGGVDPVSGTFAGLPDGSVFSVGFQDFRINYDANSATNSEGGGNDVAITFIPEPGSAMLLLGGLGMLASRRRRK